MAIVLNRSGTFAPLTHHDLKKFAKNNQRQKCGKLSKHFGISGAYFALSCTCKDVLERFK
jgi:hypothetical protein